MRATVCVTQPKRKIGRRCLFEFLNSVLRNIILTKSISPDYQCKKCHTFPPPHASFFIRPFHFGYHPQNMNKFEMFKSPKKYVDSMGTKHKVLGTHKGYKSLAWDRIVRQYNFYLAGKGQGAGSISEFISEWVKGSP